MLFIHDDFLLSCEESVTLYEQYAADEPILDYHCHLPPADLASNKRFGNLYDIWLEGDHYKWRAMRSNGVAERFCTGDMEPFEKFMAWAKTVPYTLRNPLYHWSHLELKRYFDIDELLDEKSAKRIWDQANEKLAGVEMSAWGILDRFDVRCVCTTDDPADDLAHHKTLAGSGLKTKVYPTFRPDKALTVCDGKAFNDWVDRLGEVADIDIVAFDDLLNAIDMRHAVFHELGCRLSDHGLEVCFANFCDKSEARQIFNKARSGGSVTAEEGDRFCSYMMLYFGQLDAKRGWTKQLHLGAMRNNNSRAFGQLGADTGFDSIGDFSQAKKLSMYLDRLNLEGALPKTILYNLNPSDNYVFASMLGNFQDSSMAGKIQLGSGWWFLDQRQGMTWQIDALSNLGLLSRFVGMLTDSRSFMSYPRHEYFRRLLCDMLGKDMRAGKLPIDMELVGGMIRNICFNNAKQYFELGLD
ncbi:glucuronate isomerase [Poriferisphaera sp. WC338]|uniref:glucuronate isomerase n=1 Tax=Poriferisphaera sp. WC338 TaxID=3425129 RepID=UPI003D81A108